MCKSLLAFFCSVHKSAWSKLNFDRVQLYSSCHATYFNDLHHLLSMVFLSPPPPPGILYLSLAHSSGEDLMGEGGGATLKVPSSLVWSEQQASKAARWHRRKSSCSRSLPPAASPLVLPCTHDFAALSDYVPVTENSIIFFFSGPFFISLNPQVFMCILKCLYLTILTSGMLLSTYLSLKVGQQTSNLGRTK